MEKKPIKRKLHNRKYNIAFCISVKRPYDNER